MSRIRCKTSCRGLDSTHVVGKVFALALSLGVMCIGRQAGHDACNSRQGCSSMSLVVRQLCVSNLEIAEGGLNAPCMQICVHVVIFTQVCIAGVSVMLFRY